MRQRVSLCVTASHAYLHGPVQTRISIENTKRRDAFAQAIQLCRNHAPHARIEVEVQLGMDFARLAIMTVDRPGGIDSLPASKREGIVHAWTADMLHVAVHDQIIRWCKLADPQKVLVSCVDRGVAEDLDHACQEGDVQFASCRPAVLSATWRAKDLPPDTTVVWTEDGPSSRRHSVVQLLHLRDREPTASWRGWLPVDDDDSDEQMGLLISWFESESNAGGAPHTKLRWPNPELVTE